jgi:hypothetical protein
MNPLLLKQTLIKSLIGYGLFTIAFFIFGFYTAQNILTLIGAIYISLAWVKYLFKDNFLKFQKKHDTPAQSIHHSVPIISSLLAGLVCLIIALF